MAESNKLQSLLDRVRANRGEARPQRAASLLEQLKSAAGQAPEPAQPPPSTPAPPTSTRYSSRPPGVERPLAGVASSAPRPSAAPTASRTGAPASVRPVSLRPDSAPPPSQPVVRSTEAPEFPRAKTFGELLELTLSLRPR